MSKNKYYWIKERSNPQTGTYYIAYANSISIKEAKEKEKTLYGYNYMYRFNSKSEYDNFIEKLKENNERIRMNECKHF